MSACEDNCPDDACAVIWERGMDRLRNELLYHNPRIDPTAWRLRELVRRDLWFSLEGDWVYSAIHEAVLQAREEQ